MYCSDVGIVLCTRLKVIGKTQVASYIFLRSI